MYPAETMAQWVSGGRLAERKCWCSTIWSTGMCNS